jgi:hypothetical protein
MRLQHILKSFAKIEKEELTRSNIHSATIPQMRACGCLSNVANYLIVKKMNYNKFLLAFLFFIFASSFVIGQTLLGIKGGLNYSTQIEYFLPMDHSAGADIYTSYPSYCFEFELKGRKPAHVHAGGSIMYSLDNFSWYTVTGGHFPDEYFNKYQLKCLRIAIFPEFLTGKRIQFFCNASPYLNIIISSIKSGYKSSYEWKNSFYQLVTTEVTGSAYDNFKQIDIGFQETAGLSFLVYPWLGLTFEENGSLGCLNANKNAYNWNVKNASIRLLWGLTFIIPGTKQQKEKISKS